MSQIEKPVDWFDRVLPETVEQHPEKVAGFVGTMLFTITGDHGGVWTVHFDDGNVLRTHTTAISTQMLYLLGNQPEFKPMKYFSIDRVFRNETLDATHLAEFH